MFTDNKSYNNRNCSKYRPSLLAHNTFLCSKLNSLTYLRLLRNEDFVLSFIMLTTDIFLHTTVGDKVRNDEVLRRMGEERRILKVIENRKRNWLGRCV